MNKWFIVEVCGTNNKIVDVPPPVERVPEVVNGWTIIRPRQPSLVQVAQGVCDLLNADPK